MVHPWIIAHRGARSLAPENTLAAFARAHDLGTQMIEFDVRLSKDGIPVVLHNETLDETTDIAAFQERWRLTPPVPVSSLLLARLKELDAGSWFDRSFKGEPIPTLQETLDLIGKADCWANIELKEAPPSSLPEKVVQVVYESGMADKVLVSSFDQPALLQMKALAPDLKRALLLTELPEGGLDPDDPLQPHAYHLRAKACPRKSISEWLPRGVRLNVWTVNEKVDLAYFVKAGVDGICTDYPQRLKGILESD